MRRPPAVNVLLLALAILVGACSEQDSGPDPIAITRRDLHPVITAPLPGDRPSVGTDARSHTGEPVQIACATCHDTRPPHVLTASSADLDEFHQGLVYHHGDITCLSCHDGADYDRLHRADGRPVAFAQARELCAQCHGPQAADYDRGLHGGLSGHWSRQYGPQVRNDCLHCHDPHHPALRQVWPASPPADADNVVDHHQEAGHGQ